ncbi:MAG: hypothetical protein JO101_09555, partial [Candidatus Eremiobacteraeota bacterium]|nr:hypothetical protein [Candidatus Eremiobacteraeota bacterium]
MPTDTVVRSGRLLRERMIIRRTAEMLVAALEPADRFGGVCKLLASQFGAHFVAIAEVAPAKTVVRWSFAADPASLNAIAEVAASGIDPQTPGVHPISGERVVLFLPLRLGVHHFGFLALGGGPERFAREDITLLETCARYMAVAIYNVTLALEKERLEALASHDGLTGLYNRRALD